MTDFVEIESAPGALSFSIPRGSCLRAELPAESSETSEEPVAAASLSEQ